MLIWEIYINHKYINISLKISKFHLYLKNNFQI